MVKSRRSASKTGSTNASTEFTTNKKKSLILDYTLSPLLCRKLKFETFKKGNIKENIVKRIISHKKTKNSLTFEVEWESDQDTFPQASSIHLTSAKKHCPSELIDYLISHLAGNKPL